MCYAPEVSSCILCMTTWGGNHTSKYYALRCLTTPQSVNSRIIGCKYIHNLSNDVYHLNCIEMPKCINYL